MSATATQPRPGLVIITSELTPYRVHFHQRVAREIPELKLWSLLTRDSKWSAWDMGDPADINLVRLCEGTLDDFKNHKTRFQLRAARDTVRWLGANRPAAILVNGYDELSRLRAILWGRKHKTPVLLWGDSNIKGDTASGLRRVVKNTVIPPVLKRCSALLACGSLGRAYFRRYGVPDEKIFYSPVEPDYAPLLTPDDALVERTRESLGLDPRRFRLVISSRLVPFKRVDLAIDAFAAIADRRPDWDLLILGDGPQRQELQQRVPEPLRSRVKFAGFIGKQDVVTAAYRASHILLHVPSFEPWALVINEAAAAGLAIISSDIVGASPELVRDGMNGRIVPSGNLAALTDAILEVTDPPTLNAMRSASHAVLADWRSRGDPVQGLRQALTYTGVLPLEPNLTRS